ncbi:hypothetical protein B1B_04608, partial [mine drainage metagenome]
MAIHKHVDDTGLVTCTNGTSMHVKITAQGVGLTAGKSRIDNGVGTFTDVHTIDDVLGSYAQGEVNAGLVKSGSAQVLTKGTVSLALAGSGLGYRSRLVLYCRKTDGFAVQADQALNNRPGEAFANPDPDRRALWRGAECSLRHRV